MYQYDDSTAISVMPTPATAGTPGFFTDGNPSTGSPATILRSDFMNTIMMEILNVVEAAGITPSKTNDAQLLAAVNELIAAGTSGYETASAAVAAAATAATATATAIASAASIAASATAAVSAAQLGVSQSLISLAGSRLSGTVYQNTTSRPITVSVSAASGENTSASFAMGPTSSVIAMLTSACGNYSGSSASGTITVPAGWYYSVTIGGAGIGYWSELR